MNVRHAIESDPAELGRRYPSFVLNVRNRLKLHVRILRDRLELSAHPRGARELPFVAKMTTDAALDAATALALPAIAADTVGGAGSASSLRCSPRLPIGRGVLLRSIVTCVAHYPAVGNTTQSCSFLLS